MQYRSFCVGTMLLRRALKPSHPEALRRFLQCVSAQLISWPDLSRPVPVPWMIRLEVLKWRGRGRYGETTSFKGAGPQDTGASYMLVHDLTWPLHTITFRTQHTFNFCVVRCCQTVYTVETHNNKCLFLLERLGKFLYCWQHVGILDISSWLYTCVDDKSEFQVHNCQFRRPESKIWNRGTRYSISPL